VKSLFGDVANSGRTARFLFALDGPQTDLEPQRQLALAQCALGNTAKAAAIALKSDRVRAPDRDE